MNIYTVKGSGELQAYSTPRKAIESLLNKVYAEYAYTLVYSHMDTEKNESVYIKLTEENVNKLITKLNSDHFLTVYDNSENDYVNIERITVK